MLAKVLTDKNTFDGLILYIQVCITTSMQAIYENLLVELPLAGFFLRKLISRAGRVDVHHLSSLDPELYRSISCSYHTLSFSLPHPLIFIATPSHSHCHTLSFSLPHTLILIATPSHSHCHTLSFSLPHPLILITTPSHSHYHTLSFSLPHPLILIATPSHSHCPAPSFSWYTSYM